jgi:hypothetical protein
MGEGPGVPDNDYCLHVYGKGEHIIQVGNGDFLTLTCRPANDAHRGAAFPTLKQNLPDPADLPIPFLAFWVIEIDDEIRFSITSQGVRRSLREIAAKSCISGAPKREPAAAKAGTPGTKVI